MLIVDGIWLIALGALAASGAIVAKRADAKQVLDKLAPYQGWMGLVAALWGVWVLIDLVRNLALLKAGVLGIVVWVLFAAVGVCLIGLGSILGTALAKTYVKDPKAQEKMDQLYNKLSPMRNTIGFVGIGLGLAFIILSVMI